ncbi:nucleotidyl transferase AbiEii/AbiGii toxin family protein [Paraburkholderia sp. C35]|uniref:nucleotidyl transferase AbiEii/AbiGii toxin family protein n=1 Tax=Paraburkholderia sp. C35 TaxID=2126993 RepID=UPI000D69DC50|nr:nucleotidyl transferase AbiEii/AbiGii toxin family protein [Paraburkholderia sp. C35]
MPIKLLDSHPFPEVSVAVLREVSLAANATGAEWFIGGATARDILTTHRFGIEQSRATADIDIGVSIESWQGDGELRAALIATGKFEQSEAAQRLHYRVPGTNGLMWLDIIPFGGIEKNGKREIAWPPDEALRLNVAGFGEALHAAIEVELAADLVVYVASLPALAMLKIIAWRDRHTQHARDATDLRFLLAKYAEAGNHDRLYAGDAEDLLEAHEFDPDVAGAALLARDMAPLVAPMLRPQILAALSPGEAYPPMLNQMLGGGHRLLLLDGETPGATEQLFNAFRTTLEKAFTPNR